MLDAHVGLTLAVENFNLVFPTHASAVYVEDAKDLILEFSSPPFVPLSFQLAPHCL